MQGEKIDEIGGIEELEVFFEVFVVVGVEEDFSVEALEAHLLKRDGRLCQVLGEALPFFFSMLSLWRERICS